MLGCTEYWWQRGQPRSVGKQLESSDSKLTAALSTYRTVRSDVADVVQSLQGELRNAVQTVKSGPGNDPLREQILDIEQSFLQLEGKLSIGSRAAYGELSGQLRSLSKAIDAGETPTFATFGTFAARTLSFLANELSVPAPVLAS